MCIWTGFKHIFVCIELREGVWTGFQHMFGCIEGGGHVFNVCLGVYKKSVGCVSVSI